MNNNHNRSQSISSSQTTNKRKIPPTKNPNRKKKIQKNLKSTTISTINFEDDTNDTDEENVHQSNEPSSVWQYATRSDDKKFSICTLCNKRISTSNWSTTCLRRHLIQVHDKTELILINEKSEQTSTINPTIKEKFHRLSVEAIIKDNLPFNAFMKSGLSKIMKEAIPGNIQLY